MAKFGPVIIIDDDEDDKELLEELLREIGVSNTLIWFTHFGGAMEFLLSTTEQPFLILCDINLPGKTGIEFKREIDEDPNLRKKSIPFVFFSTSTDRKTVNEAYTQMTVQGYFQKKGSYAEMKRTLQIIVDYWEVCRHPNS